MNNEEVIRHMIDFIEKKELQLQADSTKPDGQKKKEAVTMIISELDKECKDED